MATNQVIVDRERIFCFLPKQVVSCLWKEIKNCCTFPVINCFPRVIIRPHAGDCSDYVHLVECVKVVVTQDKFTVAVRLMKM